MQQQTRAKAKMTFDIPRLAVVRELPTAQLPKKGSVDAAGFDLFAAEPASVDAGKRLLVDTGIVIAIPEGTYARVAPRSGLAVKGVDVGAGVIDRDYRGRVRVLIINNSDKEFIIQIGDRIAQLILEKVADDVAVNEFSDVAQLGITSRGAGGFGSTGIN